MKRAYTLPAAATVLAALAGCPAPADTRDPWPTPAPTPAVTQTTPSRPTTATQTAQPTRRQATAPPTRRATTQATTAAPAVTGDADPTEPVTGVGYDDCDELRHDYPAGVPDTHPAYDPALDTNGDGTACEATQ